MDGSIVFRFSKRRFLELVWDWFWSNRTIEHLGNFCVWYSNAVGARDRLFLYQSVPYKR